jgi:hypothetical protein
MTHSVSIPAGIRFSITLDPEGIKATKYMEVADVVRDYIRRGYEVTYLKLL